MGANNWVTMAGLDFTLTPRIRYRAGSQGEGTPCRLSGQDQPSAMPPLIDSGLLQLRGRWDSRVVGLVSVCLILVRVSSPPPQDAAHSLPWVWRGRDHYSRHGERHEEGDREYNKHKSREQSCLWARRVHARTERGGDAGQKQQDSGALLIPPPALNCLRLIQCTVPSRPVCQDQAFTLTPASSSEQALGEREPVGDIHGRGRFETCPYRESPT